MKSKKLRENEITSSGLNEKNILNKHENQEGILQIVNKRFVIEKEERIIEKISYYVTILKKFIEKKKNIEKVENELTNWVKINQETIKEIDSYQDNIIQIKKEENSIKNLENSLQDNSLTDSLYSSEHWSMKWDIEEENLVSIKH